MPHASGGVASWAPGEEPTFEWPDLPLMAILPRAEDLMLELYVRGTTEAAVRRQPPHAFTWTPGAPPSSSTLGVHGTTSSVAVHERWTAAAHPQADVISLISTDGDALAMRCYSPLRLAWAGDSLVVSTIEQELVMFDQLARLLDGGAPVPSVR
jgi:hypothetical protein